ncbi:MAG: OmpA family protein [Rhodospirillales bacterium]|nr:OmpA family protein [Rhodospirillales bacterium]
MNKAMTVALAAGGAVFLAGCGVTFDYEGLRKTEFKGGGFDARLAREYKVLSLFEADLMSDWPDAAGYGEKALIAGSGNTVPPDNLKNRALPAEMMPVLKSALGRLNKVLTKDALARNPESAAAAQAGFDCWAEQQEENFQDDHIAACRAKFLSAVRKLETALTRSDVGYKNLAGMYPGMKPRSAAAAGREAPKDIVELYFDFDRALLTKPASLAVSKVAKAYRNGAPVRIILNAHTDRAGPRPYNTRLSRLRGETVRRRLIELGVPNQMISIFAWGETRPKVVGVDGAREPLNRRVEIGLSVLENS